MNQYISVPPSTAPSNANTPNPNPLPNTSSTDTGTNAEQIMKTIEQLDVFRMTQELVDRVNNGKLAAKDIFNEAGPIRSRINKVKQGLAQLEGVEDEDLTVRLNKIEELEYRVMRKQELLKRFQSVMGIEKEKCEKEENGNSSGNGNDNSNGNNETVKNESMDGDWDGNGNDDINQYEKGDGDANDGDIVMGGL